MASIDTSYEIIKEISKKYADAMGNILRKLRILLTERNVEKYTLARVMEAVKQIVYNEIATLHMDKFVAKTLLQATYNNIYEWAKELKIGRKGLTNEQIELLMSRSRRQLKIAYQQVLAASHSVEASMIKSSMTVARSILEEITTAKRLGVPLSQSLRTTGQFLKDFTFVDKAGRKWNPTSYMEMAARTQVNTINGEVSKQLSNTIDNDLRIIDTQMGACPECFNFHDNVISMNIMASKDEIEAIEDDGFIYAGTFKQVQALGFYHPNCRCLLNVYMVGVSVKSVSNNESKNSKNYQDRQQQRYMERQIRKWKYNEQGALRQSERNFAHRKMLDWQKELRTFARQNNLTRMRWRESITFNTYSDGQWEKNWLLGKTEQLNKEFFEGLYFL